MVTWIVSCNSCSWTYQSDALDKAQREARWHEELSRLRLGAGGMSRQRDKGTLAETMLVEYLRAHGYPRAERRALAGILDRGDVSGVDGVCIEVKAHTTPSYGAWLEEVERERVNAGARIGVVVHKPAGIGVARVGSWRALMTVDTMLELLRTLR